MIPEKRIERYGFENLALENEGGPKTEAPGQKQIPQELLIN